MQDAPQPPGPAALSPAVTHLLQQASAALGRDQVGPAVRLLERARRLAPDAAQVQRLAGIAAAMAGDYPKAVEHLRQALAARPDDASIHLALGRALVVLDDVDTGMAHLRRACALDPDNMTIWFSLGGALQSMADLGGARDAFEHALRIDPDFIPARNKLAHVLLSVGDIPAAVAMLRDTLSRHADCVDAWVTLGEIKSERLSQDDATALRALLDRPDLPDDSRVRLGFTLARALEDQADFGAAFAALGKANALRRQQLPWDRAAECARVDAIAQAFQHAPPEPADTRFGNEVIFIVSLPRAASTLTEQILASHAAVQAGDELQVLPELLNEESGRRGQAFPAWVGTASAADWRRLGEAYLERAYGRLRNHPARFTDKSVDNWAFVGAALAMLPGAHVVNSRRDALETCFACYRQWFPNGCAFTYDLDAMVGYYAGYEHLCALWRKQYPHRWFNHDYEALQDDMEGQVRRLLAFCKLPFDPACLAFHQTRRTIRTLSASQVREPLRHDTARGALYGTLLDPWRAALRTAGLLKTAARNSP